MNLTLPQQDIYFDQLIYSEAPIYNIGAKIIIKGEISYECMNKAYNLLIQQHDSFRSFIILENEYPTIKFAETFEDSLEFIDFSDKSNSVELTNKFVQEEFQKLLPFGNNNFLHKFILIKCQDSLYYLFSVYHHVITDGWGTSLMFQRLISNYNELFVFGDVQTDYTYTYKDFIDDDTHYINSKSYSDDEKYWLTKFAILPHRLFEKKENNFTEAISSRQSLIVPRALYKQLIVTSNEFKCSTFHVILALIYLYFGRKHQNADFAIGIPVLNRNTAKFKKTVGLFMGLSLLRVNIDFNDTFSSLLYNIKQQLRQDYRHQRFPLGKLMKSLNMISDKNELFNITLSYEKQDYSAHFHDTITDVIPLSHHSERVALAIYIREFDDLQDVTIDFDYNLGYFDHVNINEIIIHFKNLLESVCANPHLELNSYNYLSAQETQLILHDFNNTYSVYDHTITFLHLFKECVSNRQEKIALIDEKVSYSYAELDILSNKVACFINNLHNEIGMFPIAVLMNKSANLIITLLGILKTGRAYIPLDPNFPKNRLDYIVHHSAVGCVIGDKKLRNIIDNNSLFLDFNEIINSSISDIVCFNVNPADTAYIIYTSGSTGLPKGVEISHQSLLNLLLSIRKKPGLKDVDIMFSVTTQSFDISILEYFAPLISGAALYVASEELLVDPFVTIRKIDEIQATIMQATPSFYQMLFNAGWNGNSKLKVLCGGDILSRALAIKLIETCYEVWNMYGPTETTIWSSVKRIKCIEDASTIGSPIDNTSFYILDSGLHILPVGCTGNVYIGGDGLAKGYLNNFMLTAEKFIVNPFDENKKIYNTGDLGRWNYNGEIEFAGRADNQVKIRGYRIESGDIETKINSFPEVISSVVVVNKQTDQEPILVAYLITKANNFSVNAVLTYLRSELPEYMIPHGVIVVDKFPITPNNKIDRKELSLRKTSYTAQPAFVPAVTFLEKKLCILYSQVLLIEVNIGATDNFFALGGHSLSAVKLINSISKELNYSVSLRELVQNPTARMLSQILLQKSRKAHHPIELINERPYYKISDAQNNIWLASNIDQISVAYNMFAAFEIQGNLNIEKLEYVFKIIIAKHEILRANFIEEHGSIKQLFKKANDITFKINTYYTFITEFEFTIAEFANKVFKLDHDLLIRAGLFKTDDNRSFLVFVTHHVIMDGWSLRVLIDEIVAAYLQESIVKVDELPFQYKDYAYWHSSKCLTREDINQHFWQKYLLGYKWIPVLPKYQQSNIDTHKAGIFRFQWDKQFVSAILAAAQQQGVTLHTYLVTAFNILLYKTFERNDICIGIVNSGRNHLDLQNQLGMFVKTLPLRTRIADKDNFLHVLENTRESILSLDEHQDLPLSISSEISLDILLVLQDTLLDYNNIPVGDDLILNMHPINPYYSRLPLLVNMAHLEGSISVEACFNIAEHSQEAIEIIFSRYELVLRTLILNNDVLIKNLDITLDFEKESSVEIDFNF